MTTSVERSDGRDLPRDAEEVRRLLDAHDYLADQGTATAIFLSLRLGLPLLLEGEPGVGKTAAAKVLALAESPS